MKKYEIVAWWMNLVSRNAPLTPLFQEYTSDMKSVTKFAGEPLPKFSYQGFADALQYAFEVGQVNTTTPEKLHSRYYCDKRQGVPYNDGTAPAPVDTDPVSPPQQLSLLGELEALENAYVFGDRDYLSELYNLANEAFFATGQTRYHKLALEIVRAKGDD